MSHVSHVRLLGCAAALLALSVLAVAQDQTLKLGGVACASPPILHCPDKDCPSDRVINPGPIVEMKTRRTYFLDYPCDLKQGEKVNPVQPSRRRLMVTGSALFPDHGLPDKCS
jgi:hypothetical protein